MHHNDSNHGSRSQLSRILNTVAEGIYCIDLNGVCTYCNARCVDLLGYDSDAELLGKNMHELIHYRHRDGRDCPTSDCKILKSCHGGSSGHVDDEVFWRKDKSRFDVEYWSSAIVDDGAVIGAAVSFVDITVRRIENAHRNQLARLVETSHDAIISKNLSGIITSWNQGAIDIYGFDAEEMIGNTCRSILPTGQHDEEVQLKLALRDGTDLPQFEVKRQRKNGDACDVSVTVSPLYDSDGNLAGCSCIERDITERRHSHDAMMSAMTAAESARKMAGEANKSRTEFLANVSHELRTPMNAILGMLQLSLDEQLDPVVSDYLSVAKTSAISLLHLVDELLDFAKIESGKFEIINEPFDIRESVDIPAKVISGRASEKGLEILCEVDSNVPQVLIGDGRRIQQVLTNLFSNAVKFTERGEIVAKVKLVRELPSEVQLRFSVSDTGIGISKEDQVEILLPFQQADMSSTRKHHGTGLGLSICRELVALMGGILKVSSEPGQGSRFYFHLSLPIKDQAKPADNLPTELVENLKVLIVDDNPTNLRILEKIFVSWSMQPITSTSAEQALRILDELEATDQKVSMAIVDSLMPQVDGYKLADKVIKKTGDDCPPIVMMQSAADMGMYSDRKLDAPVAHYLTKPISQSELLDAVVDTLDLYSHESKRAEVARIRPATDAPILPLNILLADDLPANQKVAQAILEKRGHKVTTALNGRMAIDQLQSSDQSFDVVLMDIQMPVVDGFQATAAIRASPDEETAETPIIAMTAHAMQGDRESCLAAGMDAYISKPLDAKHLVELVESITNHPKQLKASNMNDRTSDNSTNPTSELQDAKPAKSQPVSDQPDFELVEYKASLRRLGGDEALFKELVQIFLDDSPEIMSDVLAAVETNQHEQLEKSAHALKGLMSNFGASPNCELASTIERAGREKRTESVAVDAEKLKARYEQLCAELIDFNRNGRTAGERT